MSRKKNETNFGGWEAGVRPLTEKKGRGSTLLFSILTDGGGGQGIKMGGDTSSNEGRGRGVSTTRDWLRAIRNYTSSLVTLGVVRRELHVDSR